MKKYLICLCLLSAHIVYGQQTNSHKGEWSFGARSVGSIFGSSDNCLGLGAGGQVRYRIDEHFNTEWFGDWMTTDIKGYGQRFDAHIGESMMIYPGKRIRQVNRFTPFVVGGFCADFTKAQTNLYYDAVQYGFVTESKERWSFATQLGVGTHYNITEKFDISFNLQYDFHFGQDINAQVQTNDVGVKYLQIQQKNENALEGHLFFTVSANFVFANFSKK